MCDPEKSGQAATDDEQCSDVGYITIRIIFLNPADPSSSFVDPERKVLQIVCLLPFLPAREAKVLTLRSLLQSRKSTIMPPAKQKEGEGFS